MHLLTLLVAAVSLANVTARAELDLPPTPASQDLIHDHAGMLSDEAKHVIESRQREALAQHGTPIVVVIIDFMEDFGGDSHTIDRFAREWFDRWQIGARDASGQTVDRGILLLISVGDRKARIELGQEWGKRWDRHCQHIMDDIIVPKFKAGDYSKGTAAGVEALYTEVVAHGPDGQPPEPRVGTSKPSLSTSPLPFWATFAMVVGGVSLIIMGVIYRDKRKPFILTGIVLLIAGVAIWVIIAAIAIVVMAKGRGTGNANDSTWSRSSGASGRFGGGSSGGSSGGFSGGFSGGSSGGGGASGSW